MGKAIVGFILGLACLSLFSLNYGFKVFSQWERQVSAESRIEGKYAPDDRESRGKKIRWVFNSFDLANGLTFQEFEDFSREPRYRFFAFLSLIAALWLVATLRKPGRHDL